MSTILNRRSSVPRHPLAWAGVLNLTVAVGYLALRIRIDRWLDHATFGDTGTAAGFAALAMMLYSGLALLALLLAGGYYGVDLWRRDAASGGEQFLRAGLLGGCGAAVQLLSIAAALADPYASVGALMLVGVFMSASAFAVALVGVSRN